MKELKIIYERALARLRLFGIAYLFPVIAASCCVVNCWEVTPEPCTEADLRKIEIAYQAELVAKCAGQGADCVAKPAVDAKYRRKRAAWVACEPDPQAGTP